jgi:hypothetical protein
LNPHEDIALFHLPGGHMDRALERESRASHMAAVSSYRAKMRPIAEAVRLGARAS